MGAELNYRIVEANSSREAYDKAYQDAVEWSGNDPYNGDFNTCVEYFDAKALKGLDTFKSWVEEYGEKRVAYTYPLDKGKYAIMAWCAC
jgi:hypothetical protein